MKKACLCLCLCVFLAVTAHGQGLSLKANFGGTYLIGGDYNKGITGFRDYELSVLGASETFVDEMDLLGLGFQAGAEVLYSFGPSLAVGLEAGYLSASTTSHLERTWHSYNWTIEPTLSAIPVTLNVYYFMPLGNKLKLSIMAGSGAFISSLNYKYDIYDISYPYDGTWAPDTKVVFGAKAGIGVVYSLTDRIALTLDLAGRFAEVEGFTGAWEGTYDGVQRSGTGTLYTFEYDGTYQMIGIWETEPTNTHYENVRLAKFSLSGMSFLFGVIFYF